MTDTYLLQAKLDSKRKKKYEQLKEHHLRSKNNDMVSWLIDEAWERIQEKPHEPAPQS